MVKLCDLVGLTIQMAKKLQDYAQIGFKDGIILNIYNNYVLSGKDISSLEGKRIVEIKETEREIVIFLENDQQMKIGLLDQDFNGPEALELNCIDSPPVVWQ